MSLTLETFSAGITDYILRHNNNNSAIQALVNVLEAEVNALKAAGGAGADLDFRLATPNLLINGGLDYWQRGSSSRPDAWRIRNQAGNFAVARESSTVKLNTYSAKTTNLGQLTQSLPDSIRLGIDSTTIFSFGAYVKTDTADQAKIGIYNGVTTQWSNYHSGGNEWEWLTESIATSGSIPSELRFVLDTSGGTVYWNAVVVIRGNPSAGPTFIANDPVLEELRVLSLYEIGANHIQGVGYLNLGDRELEKHIQFMSLKRAIPTVTIAEAETGYDFLAANVSRYGFDLVVAELGGASGSNGFAYDDIDWTAEVTNT